MSTANCQQRTANTSSSHRLGEVAANSEVVAISTPLLSKGSRWKLEVEVGS